MDAYNLQNIEAECLELVQQGWSQVDGLYFP